MKLRNLYLAIKDQGPFRRFFRNFFITRNGWGLFHQNSHRSKATGEKKVMYGSRASAEKAAANMKKKTGNHFSVYKCLFCDGFHIGKNKWYNYKDKSL